MRLIIIFMLLAILIETTLLVAKKYQPSFNHKRKIYVDTSALIDGRILDIVKCGFLDGKLIILRSVLSELQLLADGKISEKRTRARAGLDVVSELERIENIHTEIIEDHTKHEKVDDILLKMAKESHGAIVTLDYNLIKVAKAEGIETLNINDLAMAIRGKFLLGEKVKIKILEKGSGRGQGLGRLDDGTLVVVEKAAKKIGQVVLVEFTKFHETSAGKMVFSKIAND